MHWWIQGRTLKLVLASIALLTLIFASGFDRKLRIVVFGAKSVEQRLEEFGPGARGRLRAALEQAGLSYPPQRAYFVANKSDARLALYVCGADESWRYIESYPIRAASGDLGPKLREGDRQVPEGLYAIESLNPNSRFHVALRLNYPSPWDLLRAAEDKRSEPGSDIMIHGGSASVGCLAMGDEVAEELFTLAADIGIDQVQVLICPLDLRHSPLPPDYPTGPNWIGEHLIRIKTALEYLPERDQ